MQTDATRFGATCEVFDPDAMLARLRGDRKLLKEVVELFLDDYPQILARIGAAIASGNAKELMTTAHYLRGAIGSFSVASAFDLATQLELLGGRGQTDNAEPILTALENEVDRLAACLRHYLHENSAPVAGGRE